MIGFMGHVARFAVHRRPQRRSGGFFISYLSMIICQCMKLPKRRQGRFSRGRFSPAIETNDN